MTRLFVSLYVGLLTTLFAVIYVAHLINTYLIIDVENIMAAESFSAEVVLLEELSELVSSQKVDALMATIARRNQVLITQVKLDDIPKHIQTELADKAVWFDDEDYNYFRAFSPAKYYQIAEDEDNELVQIDSTIGVIQLLTMLVAVAIWFFASQVKIPRKDA